ncbi:MAG: hypothetical protein FWG47_00945 [Propionibacteriaceae bacterium]|nr:hypothetical protein [Propionibacteriaceae bacterium]
MKRLTAIGIMLLGLAVAAVVSWSAPRETNVQFVDASIGEPVELDAALSVVLTDVALTNQLSGTYERQTSQVWLVAFVDVFVTGTSTSSPKLAVTSKVGLSLPGSIDLKLPRYHDPGFVAHCAVPVLMDPGALTGARVEITATTGLLQGFHRTARIDLGFTAAQVDELLAKRTTPVEITSPVVEVIK